MPDWPGHTVHGMQYTHNSSGFVPRAGGAQALRRASDRHVVNHVAYNVCTYIYIYIYMQPYIYIYVYIKLRLSVGLRATLATHYKGVQYSL